MDDLKASEFQGLRDEIQQRSSFQHAYMLLNVAGAGSILSFAITQGTETASRALLVLPPLSFSLLMLWLSQALAIANIGMFLEKERPIGWEAQKAVGLTPLGLCAKALTGAVGQLAHFVGAPILALLFYRALHADLSFPLSLIFALDVALVLSGAVLFLLWALQTNWRKGPKLFRSSPSSKRDSA